MLADDSGMFINTAKLDLKKYAARPALAKALFQVCTERVVETLQPPPSFPLILHSICCTWPTTPCAPKSWRRWPRSSASSRTTGGRVCYCRQRSGVPLFHQKSQPHPTPPLSSPCSYAWFLLLPPRHAARRGAAVHVIHPRPAERVGGASPRQGGPVRPVVSAATTIPASNTTHAVQVYIRLDQPQNALRTYTEALKQFPGETSFMSGVCSPPAAQTGIAAVAHARLGPLPRKNQPMPNPTSSPGMARVYEGIGDLPTAVAQYRKLLAFDSTNVEAIASIAADNFYSDHPEAALVQYRWVWCGPGQQRAELQTGLFSASSPLQPDSSLAQTTAADGGV